MEVRLFDPCTCGSEEEGSHPGQAGLQSKILSQKNKMKERKKRGKRGDGVGRRREKEGEGSHQVMRLTN